MERLAEPTHLNQALPRLHGDVVQLYADSCDRAVVEERMRLSRDLHDSVCQSLNAIALAADAARGMCSAADVPAPLRQFVEFVAAQAWAAAGEVRDIIFDLRSEAVERKGLIAALRQEIMRLQFQANVTVELTSFDEPVAPMEVKETLYRIAQEALHNASRHAHAGRLVVSLEASGEALALEVADDGIGFDPRDPVPGHLGLRSMRERAASLGGWLKVLSAPDRGTSVTVCVPLCCPDRTTETSGQPVA